MNWKLGPMKLLYHHCTDVRVARQGSCLEPSPEKTLFWSKEESFIDGSDPLSEDYEVKPNLWLAEKVGFYPLFMAAGEKIDDIMMTGYQNNWRRVIAQVPGEKGKPRSIFRKKGEINNRVLFSFEDALESFCDKYAFVDYENWFLVLNAHHCNFNIPDRERRMILRPSWNKADWLRYARKSYSAVMLVVNRLNLSATGRIWVRNEATRRELSERFQNVRVRRIPVGE